MRLLFLNHNLRERGTYFRAFHLARELVSRGHEATLLTASPDHWYRPVEESIDGVRVVEMPSWNPWIDRDDGWGPVDIAWRIGRVLREDFDLAYGFAHPPSVAVPLSVARRIRRRPVVVDWCDVYRDGIFPLREEYRRYTGAGADWRLRVQRAAERAEARLERSTVRHADGVTVISKYLEDAAMREGVPRDRLLRFPSGANLDAISVQDRTEARTALDLEGEESPLIGYIANYNPDERFFLRAVREALRRVPEARLLAACPPFTASVVEQEGLNGKVIHLGRVPFARVPLVLGAADVLAMPLEDNTSNRGRWPNKFGDYLAAGRPVVTNTVGDAVRYFETVWEGGDAPERTEVRGIGIATAPRSDLMGEAMATFLRDPEQRRVAGAAARRLAEGDLAWPRIAGPVEDFLQGLVARGQS